MKENPRNPARPLRARILLHALIGALAITSAIALSDGEAAGHRTGALLLLLSGVLFITVVIVDSVHALHDRPNSARTDIAPKQPASATPGADRTITRRVRSPRPAPQARS